MANLKFPIGVQSFSEIIEKKYAYVDKTAYIPGLTEHGKYIFLSRPRRFGKSLLLSTLKAYFEGRRELFQGLALDRLDVDWTPAPVLYFDFVNGLYETPEGLLAKLHSMLSHYEETYGLPGGEREREEIPDRFRRLIETVFEVTGKQVVILVDEYDKPLLTIEENKIVLDKHQRLLKSFYSNFKSLDSCIRFAFITGVARFSKVSIFSDFNNLDDISLENSFADVCGWTEEEFVSVFRSGISDLSDEREESFDATLQTLRDYYDGYLFTPKGSRLYNPFSVLRALKAKEIDPYWFDTGTPSFLIKRIRQAEIYPPELNGIKCSRDQLISVRIDSPDPVPLMFQTGYLTISSYDPATRRFELRFPNKEVEIGFYKDLLPQYVPASTNPMSPFNFNKFMDDLSQGHPEDFMRRLASLLKDLPGEDHREASYRAITYLLALLASTDVIAEHHGYKGRSDLEVCTGNFIYIFEFKYNKSVQAAMDQILDRDYAGRYEMDSRGLYLIGANFSTRKNNRGLRYEIRKVR